MPPSSAGPRLTRVDQASWDLKAKEREGFVVPKHSLNDSQEEEEAVQTYPRRCLVFIRHIHPETNKTTLRTLLSRAYGSDTTGKELDYVDYTKGLDSVSCKWGRGGARVLKVRQCYVRLSNHMCSNRLLAYLHQNSIIQTNALDDAGEGRTGEPLTGELVEGKREALYWDKVPEKIRRVTLAKLYRDGNLGEDDLYEPRPKKRMRR